MSSVSDSVLAAAIADVRKVVENEADRVLRKLVAASEKALDDYYDFPEGNIYNRTFKFNNHSFKPYKSQNLRDPQNMEVTVGVIFERGYEYSPAGVSSEDIYTWNLAGGHGGNGNSGDILKQVNEVADKLAGK